MNESEAKAGVPAGNRPPDPATDALFTGSLLRIERLVPILAVVLSALLAIRASWQAALGFLAGAAVAYVNFRWLKSTVIVLSDVATGQGTRTSKPSVILRFLTRFVLIALVAYAIFVGSPAAFHGFLGGLFILVLAIFVEAFFVVFAVVRRGF